MSGKQSSYTVYKTYYTACQSSPGAGDLMAGYYYYNYEPVSRLMKADFIQYQGGWVKSFNYDSRMGDSADASKTSGKTCENRAHSLRKA